MTAGGNSRRLDLRGLEPPEPMRRALEAVESLEPDAALEIITDREPLLFQRELGRRRHTYVSEVQGDGCHTVIHRRIAPSGL